MVGGNILDSSDWHRGTLEALLHAQCEELEVENLRNHRTQGVTEMLPYETNQACAVWGDSSKF